MKKNDDHNLKQADKKKKGFIIAGNVINFIFCYVVCGTGIILLMHHFLFGHPIDRYNIAYSIGSGIGLAVARIIVWSMEAAWARIRVWLSCKKG